MKDHVRGGAGGAGGLRAPAPEAIDRLDWRITLRLVRLVTAAGSISCGGVPLVTA